MKNVFFLISLLYSVISFSQVKKEVLDGVFVNFPNIPEYTVAQGMPSYISKTDNNLFMVFVKRNAIPNYSQYVQAQKNWSKNEKEKIVDALLDGTINGKLDFVGVKGNTTKIKLDGFDGRKVSYKAVNPMTGKKSQVNTTVLLVRSSLVIFDVWEIKENNQKTINERNNFFESIRVN